MVARRIVLDGQTSVKLFVALAMTVAGLMSLPFGFLMVVVGLALAATILWPPKRRQGRDGSGGDSGSGDGTSASGGGSLAGGGSFGGGGASGGWGGDGGGDGGGGGGD
jgi:uncharacterized membrane protein YgcG